LSRRRISTAVVSRTAFGGEPERAVAEHFGETYTQHNPDAQDGPKAFIGYVNALRAANPEVKLDIKRLDT
jgi:predicted SnoaL-like aldol condensation-catalyzing enzyme